MTMLGGSDIRTTKSHIDTGTLAPYPKAELLEMYRLMVLIRRFEEAAAEQYTLGRIGGFLHLYIGEEAVAVGAVRALGPDDHLITHYRDHGYALARGCDPRACMAELFGRATGLVGGRGGSMHFADPSRRFWGGHTLVGDVPVLAAGLAFASAYLKKPEVTLAIFGEGATNCGAFHEGLNLASLWKLPVVFLCENNFYGMGTAVHRASAVPEIYRKACAYDIPAEQVDGQDVLAVRAVTERALEHCRAGGGPYFIEALTYRFSAHSMADAELYRSKEEVQRWRGERDPIALFRERLLSSGLVTGEDLESIHRSVEQLVDDAVRFALESPEPEPESLTRFILADS
jgi:pyruvate dehydrogenase E1 component alpha subunit